MAGEPNEEHTRPGPTQMQDQEPSLPWGVRGKGPVLKNI